MAAGCHVQEPSSLSRCFTPFLSECPSLRLCWRNVRKQECILKTKCAWNRRVSVLCGEVWSVGGVWSSCHVLSVMSDEFQCDDMKICHFYSGPNFPIQASHSLPYMTLNSCVCFSGFILLGLISCLSCLLHQSASPNPNPDLRDTLDPNL